MSEWWFTSDTHFWHKRICELADRPFDSVEEMNEALIDNWNARVRAYDHAVHLGDFSFGSRAQTEELIGRLKGNKHLIRGNHDDGIDRYADRFASIQDYREMRIEGQKIIMCHYPIESWHGAHRGAWHLHGHCHGTLKRRIGNRLDVGVDSVGYAPINVEEVSLIMSQLPEWEPADHHDVAEVVTPGS